MNHTWIQNQGYEESGAQKAPRIIDRCAHSKEKIDPYIAYSLVLIEHSSQGDIGQWVLKKDRLSTTKIRLPTIRLTSLESKLWLIVAT